MIRIAATQYCLGNRALEIYVAGCKGNPHCENCHNPELWDFSIGTLYDEDCKKPIINKILDNHNLIKRVWIVGGEPLDQDHQELYTLLQDMKNTSVEVWLFTRYDLEDVPDERQHGGGLDEPYGSGQQSARAVTRHSEFSLRCHLERQSRVQDAAFSGSKKQSAGTSRRPTANAFRHG